MSLPPGVFLALREPEDARFYPSVIPVQSFAPAVSAKVWLDTSTVPAELKVWDGLAWVGVGVAGPPGDAVAQAVTSSTVLADRALGTDGTTVGLGNGTSTFATLPDDRRFPTFAGGDARWQRDLGVVNVKAHGATGDGSTDDTADIQAAIDATPSGGTLYFPPGVYRTTSTVTVSRSITLRGSGRGASQIAAEQTSGPIVHVTGAGLGSAVSLTANAAVGATTLTVSSTAGLAAGDVLLLSDDTVPDSAYPSQLSGELVQVASVDSGTVLTLAHGDQSGAVRGTFVDLGDLAGYTTAQSAKIRKVSMASGVTVSDLTLRGNPAGFGSAAGVSLSWARGVHLSGLEIRDLGGSGIEVRSSLAVQVSDCWIHDLIDDTANGRYGYGVNVKGASSLVTVTGCLIERVRHAFTTNGDNGTPFVGVPDNVTVSGCRARATHNSSFDTHGAGFNVTFTGCTSSDSLYGFSVRARRVTISGCDVERPDLDGVTFWAFARHAVVSGLVVRDCRYGVNIENGSDIDLQDVTVKRSSSHGIRLVPVTGHGDRVKIARPRIYDVGTGGSGSIGVFINASGRVGIEVLGGIFVRTDGALAYRSAVDISAASSAIIAGNRGVNLGFASAGMIVDAGTSTVLFDNMILDGSTQDARASLPTATTTNLTSATHRLNLTKRAGMCVFNTTTNRPVFATGSTATSVWVDSTGATAHTPA